MPDKISFHLHGDNIVECERAIALIRLAFLDDGCQLRGPSGTPVCPVYDLVFPDGKIFSFTLFPGFGRWNDNVLDLVRKRGGLLREAADIIVTRVEEGHENPAIAIEFCGALPAGNQAWQRSGRAFSFGMANIPYLYVAELGGFELDANRVRKAPRMPNPAVPFSYVSYSLTSDKVVLPVFVTSPGADELSRNTHAETFGDGELLQLLRTSLLNEVDNAPIEALNKKALNLVAERAGVARKNTTLTPEQWEEAYTILDGGGSLVDYLSNNARISWAKTAYIDAITQSAQELMKIASDIGFGLTASNLPMCVIPAESRSEFGTAVVNLYQGKLSDDFVNWLNRKEHLTICWVMGFKPRGDDARPDRGLPPLSRMLIGNGEDLLTVIYGPAPASHWVKLDGSPLSLAESNGLWQAILAVSDAILVDASTIGAQVGYTNTHWYADATQLSTDPTLVEPAPLSIGENDVDTVLHLLLAHYAGSIVFEGMCNPPGGDWSGVSLLPIDQTIEYRWTSLPRVSGADGKRPDHVFQFYFPDQKPIILSVESKETAASVEANIGPRLIKYIGDLVGAPASIQRTREETQWAHSTHEFELNRFTMASGAAFLSGSKEVTQAVRNRANVDLLFSFSFGEAGRGCLIAIDATTEAGVMIRDFLLALDLSETGVKLTGGLL